MVAAAHRGGVEVVERWADEWRNLCNEAVDDQPFYRPEWIAAHIRAFSPQAKVVLVTVSCEEKLLFILPLDTGMVDIQWCSLAQASRACKQPFLPF